MRPSDYRAAGAGQRLQQQLHDPSTGSIAGHPGQPLNVYGREDYGTDFANVIGVRHDDGWQLYSQVTVADFAGKHVGEVRQLYPHHLAYPRRT